jgi:hypothetical protein
MNCIGWLDGQAGAAAFLHVLPDEQNGVSWKKSELEHITRVLVSVYAKDPAIVAGLLDGRAVS